MKNTVSTVAALLLFGITLLSSCISQTPGEVVKVDISKTGKPIEKYIYGQFIEHLGNCIYGGLWAEMIEDRKFYYPVTAEFSPWGTSSDENKHGGEFK